MEQMKLNRWSRQPLNRQDYRQAKVELDTCEGKP